MMSTGAQRILTIYIRPLDGGPITPVQVDLMEIEMQALRSGDGQRDEGRINELARQIKQQCRGTIYPERRRDQLAVLLRGLAHYQRFNGVVLDVPGVTAEQAGGNGQGTGVPEEVSQRLEQIERQAVQGARELRAEREAHQETQAQLTIVRNNYLSLRTLSDRNEARLQEAQRREERAMQDAERWQKTAQHMADETSAARREVGQLQVQQNRAREEIQRTVTALQQQQQEWSDRDQELSELRQQAVERESAVRHLEETLHKRERELEQLRQVLLDDQTDGTALSGGEDWDTTL